MVMGAEVNGQLVHQSELEKKPKLKPVPHEVLNKSAKVSNS